MILFVPGCAAAAWWQITRATDGNGLSYLYAVEWPLFAILGVYFWWMLIHTDYESVGLRGMRNHTESTSHAMAHTLPQTAEMSTPFPESDDDPELAAYNARLAGLAAQGAKTWRSPERVVVRRPQ
jgi:DNA-binding transcriptional regulator of glucitol operon